MNSSTNHECSNTIPRNTLACDNDLGCNSFFCDSAEYTKYQSLIAESESTLIDLHNQVCDAEALVCDVGLTARSGLTETVQQFLDGSASTSSTGGHSNIDHIVVTTGHYETDRITEWRRCLINRCRESVPEHRGEDRWDRQKAPGGRRRRIVREKDLPTAPPEPPPSAYICFLGQMTTKMRHDRPNEPHRQPLIMRDIATLWTCSLTADDRQYYEDFCLQIGEEYKAMHLEYRATGSYTPSERFERPDGASLWVHKKMEEKNALEREIATYETVVFPMRPPEMDAEYARREQEGRERRRMKLKLIAAEKRRLRNLPPFTPRERKRKTETPTTEDVPVDSSVLLERTTEPSTKEQNTNHKKTSSDDDGMDDLHNDDEEHNDEDEPDDDSSTGNNTSQTVQDKNQMIGVETQEQHGVDDHGLMMMHRLENSNEETTRRNNDDTGSNTDEDDDVILASNVTEI